MANRVNTPAALRQRTACNRAAGGVFDGFVLALLAPSARDVALDLGPGVGTQLLPLARVVRRIVGLDSSAAMLAAIRAAGPGPTVRLVRGSMEDLAVLDVGASFTLAYAVYSLYYAADPVGVVEAAARLLDGPAARFVAVTPDVGNNAAWFRDLGQLFPVPADVLAVPRLGRDVLLPAFRKIFRTVERARLVVTVPFRTLDAVMRYYDACAPYCRPDRRAEARAYFRARLARDGAYCIEKRSLGLVGRL